MLMRKMAKTPSMQDNLWKQDWLFWKMFSDLKTVDFSTYIYLILTIRSVYVRNLYHFGHQVNDAAMILLAGTR